MVKTGRKSLLITGASAGIGAACARLAARDYHLWLTYRSDRAGAEAVRDDCVAAGATVRLLQADVAGAVRGDRQPQQHGAEGDERDEGTDDELRRLKGVGPYAAATLLMIEKMEELVKLQVEAISNLKIDKVTVWDSGANGRADGPGGSTSQFLRGLIGSLPPIHELAEQAGIDLPEGDWDTVGGLVFDLFGRVPKRGQECEVDGYRLRVDISDDGKTQTGTTTLKLTELGQTDLVIEAATERAIGFALGIDLSDAATKVGPGLQCIPFCLRLPTEDHHGQSRTTVAQSGQKIQPF